MLTLVKQGKSEGFESCDRPIVRKRPIWVKIGDVLFCVTLKFDGWPWKTIGHLFFAVSRFVQHFIAIGEFKLELQSWNAQFESYVTLKFDGWPWKTIGHLFNATSSFVHHFIAIGDSKLELQSGYAQFGSKSTWFYGSWIAGRGVQKLCWFCNFFNDIIAQKLLKCGPQMNEHIRIIPTGLIVGYIAFP